MSESGSHFVSWELFFLQESFSQKRTNRSQSCKTVPEWVLEPQSRPLVFMPCFWCRALRIHSYLLGPEDGGLCPLVLPLGLLTGFPAAWQVEGESQGEFDLWALYLRCAVIYEYMCVRAHMKDLRTLQAKMISPITIISLWISVSFVFYVVNMLPVLSMQPVEVVCNHHVLPYKV